MVIEGIIFVMKSVEIGRGRLKKYMTTIEDLPEDQRKHFCQMVDESVMESDMDPELKEGFMYLDEQAFALGISFYDLILQMYEKEELKDRINEWKKEKGFK